jgi:NitT/TauT family transport system permease protein/sulfonate transport system permease protein
LKVKLFSERFNSFFAGIASICAFLLIWFLGTNGTALGELIPGPQVVFARILSSIFGKIGGNSLLGHVAVSLERVLIGYTIGSALGIVLGLLMGWNRYVEAIFQPIFRIIRPIPPIAWIPISIIWFGLGESAKIFLIFLSSFANVTLNAWAGAQNVDPKLVGAAKMLGANHRQIFFTITLPASVPQIFAGLQIALSACWATVVAAEMIRSVAGLGWMIIAGQDNNDMAQVLTGIVAIGVVGFLLTVIMRKAEEVLCSWNRSGK